MSAAIATISTGGRVAESDGGLVLRLGPKQEPYGMRHFDRDVFTYQPVGENAYGPSALTFQVAAAGRRRR